MSARGMITHHVPASSRLRVIRTAAAMGPLPACGATRRHRPACPPSCDLAGPDARRRPTSESTSLSPEAGLPEPGRSVVVSPPALFPGRRPRPPTFRADDRGARGRRRADRARSRRRWSDHIPPLSKPAVRSPGKAANGPDGERGCRVSVVGLGQSETGGGGNRDIAQ
jgi:hypothetical protein